MKLIISILILLINSNYYYSQKINNNIVIGALYNAKMNIGQNNIKNVNYALLIGDDFSFSSAESLLDEFSNYKVDRSKIESNISYIEDSFYFKNNTYTVFGDYIGNKLAYKEHLNNNWKIEKEKKEINGIIGQKATMTNYGRTWTAYFSTEHPFPYGPYKFNGLPGLIIEISDDKKDYVFTLKTLEKREVALDINLANYKLIDKNKYFKVVHDLKYTLAAYPPFEDAEFKKQVLDRLQMREKSENNPIELFTK